MSRIVVILHNSVVLDLFMWYDLSSRLAFMAEFILLFMNAFSLMSYNFHHLLHSEWAAKIKDDSTSCFCALLDLFYLELTTLVSF